MSESYNISGLLLASIEQSLGRFMQETDAGLADDVDILAEVQSILRGDTDGDQEEVTEPEVDTNEAGTMD